jgi:Flp pilus assembly protein TadG
MRIELSAAGLTPTAGRQGTRSRRGVAILELAISVPLVVMLVLGTIEVGRMLEVKQILDNAAREGGRQAASGQYTDSQVQTIVLQYLTNMGVPTANATVTVNDLTNPGTDAASASELDQLEVTVTVPCVDVSWLQASYFFPANAQVTSDVIWYSMTNQSYPTTVTSPSGS